MIFGSQLPASFFQRTAYFYLQGKIFPAVFDGIRNNICKQLHKLES
jgi:hypothetical protein